MFFRSSPFPIGPGQHVYFLEEEWRVVKEKEGRPGLIQLLKIRDRFGDQQEKRCKTLASEHQLVPINVNGLYARAKEETEMLRRRLQAVQEAGWEAKLQEMENKHQKALADQRAAFAKELADARAMHLDEIQLMEEEFRMERDRPDTNVEALQNELAIVRRNLEKAREEVMKVREDAECLVQLQKDELRHLRTEKNTLQNDLQTMSERCRQLAAESEANMRKWHEGQHLVQNLTRRCQQAEKERDEMKRKAQKSGSDDLYRLLNVRRSVTCDDVKRLGKFVLRAYHPDTHEKTNYSLFHSVFQSLNEAVEILGDEDIRDEYDFRGLDVARKSLNAKKNGQYVSRRHGFSEDW